MAKSIMVEQNGVASSFAFKKVARSKPDVDDEDEFEDDLDFEMF